MRTVSYAAFDERVIFHTRHVSLKAHEDIRVFEELTKEVNPDFAEKYPGFVSNLAMLLSLTSEIEFHFKGDENPMLLDLRDFWAVYSKTTGTKAMEAAIKWRKETANEITSAWVEACKLAQSPIRKPENLPFEQLTPEEQTEALQLDSPLP